MALARLIPQTEIKFVLPIAGKVQLGIYDIRGHRVKQLVDQAIEAGQHLKAWNGRSETGQIVPSGVYFARLETEDTIVSKQIVLLK